MHEMTLAIQAIRNVLEFAEENEIDEIDTVVLEIGELSLVVPEYMEEAWYAAVKHTMLERSRLLPVRAASASRHSSRRLRQRSGR